MDLSIIIVNYNTALYLKECLDSVIRLTNDLKYEIIVVDNNSFERDIESFPNLFKEAKFFFLNSNNGFGSGCNYGAGKAAGKYLVFINPDVVFLNNILYALYKSMEEISIAGACAPMLVNPNYKYQYSTGFRMGFLYEILEATMTIKFYRRLSFIVNNKYNLSKPIQVGWVSGAFIMVKREVFDQVNGFDENFFLNYEDIDLCRRLEDAGFKNYYFPNHKCIHSGLASQKKDYEVLVLNRYKSRLIFAKKHYGPILRFAVQWIHIIGLFFRIMIYSLIRSNRENKERLSGYKKSSKFYLSGGF